MTAVTGEGRSRPRVLLLAHACGPERGSEPGVGWNRALEAAKQFDTWVICQDGYAGDIRRYLESHGRVPGLTFEIVPKSAMQKCLGRIPGLYYVGYNLWHRQAFRLARRLHERIRFDLVHQVTFCGFREPGYLWKLDAPFLWGPVGGTQNYPWRFLCEAGIRGAMSEALRTVINHAQLRLSLRVRRAARKAVMVLAANSTNQQDIARAHGITPLLLLETGLSGVSDTPRAERSDAGEPRILWVGELRPFKGLSLLIKALADLPEHVHFALRVLGDGPARDRWQELARKTGVERRTTWMGRLPHAEALEQYSWADLLVFTSLRDTSGNVVLEALGAGVPVICLDHQGVHDIVTGQCGIKVPVTTRRDVIAGLRRAILELASNPIQRQQMSRAALERAREYSWSRQGERMAAVYRQVLQAPNGFARPRNAIADGGAFAEGGTLRVSTNGHGSRRSVADLTRNRELITDLSKRVAGRMAVGLRTLLGSRAGSNVGILVYHRVAPHIGGVPGPSLNVTPERFREQLAGLLARGFNVWPLSKVLNCHLRAMSVPPRTMVVTFDDGFETVYRNAWPVLRELKVPATVFVSTAYLDEEVPFPFDPWGRRYRHLVPPETYRPLTTAQSRQLTEDGLIELGSHAHTHEDFRSRPHEFRRDLETSVAILQSRFGLRDVMFAFPFGRRHTGFSGDDLVIAAKDAGVACGLTTESELVDPRSDPFQWGRFNAYDFDTCSTLAAKLEGWYTWAPKLQGRLFRERHA